MKKKLIVLVLCVLIPFLGGCAAMVAGTAATSIVVAQDRRTTGTIIDDNAIELKAKQLIVQNFDETDDFHINVTSYNNHVLLTGQVPTSQIRTKVEVLVENLPKVASLHNELMIAPPISFLNRSADTWITTKIKSSMIFKRKLNPTRVKVLTENGVVYLLGIINHEEEKQAVNIARHTKGVKKVVKMFEFIADDPNLA